MIPQEMKQGSFDELTVGDVMVRNVITADGEMSVRDLIRLLEFEQISGVPVTDGRGRLVGVVSVTDVMRLAAHAEEVVAGDISAALERTRHDDEPLDDFFAPQQRFATADALRDAGDVFEDYTVSDIMTPATFTVRETTPLIELARFLARGRIHRSLVVDGDRLIGIVTAFDVVRAVATAPRREPAPA